MPHDVTLGVTVPVPPPPAGWFDYACAVLWNGHLALIRTDSDVHAEIARWRAAPEDLPGQPSLRDRPLRLSTFDGTAESAAIEVPAPGWPEVARLPDGRWLVASNRAEPNERSAAFYSADGTPAGTFVIGDGIKHLQCAADGTIWVGYFDEGIYADALDDGSAPISSAGIARFGSDGRVLWRFNDHAPAGAGIDECYAMTVAGTALWCCAYGDFPIVRVERDAMTVWLNELIGATALAVEGDHVLLAGGYREESNRFALLRLSDGVAEQIGEWRHDPIGKAGRLVQGLGDTLHIVERGNWTRIAVGMLRAQAPPPVESTSPGFE